MLSVKFLEGLRDYVKRHVQEALPRGIAPDLTGAMAEMERAELLEPTKPEESLEPAEPTEPVDTAQSTEPVSTAQLTEPVEPATAESQAILQESAPEEELSEMPAAAGTMSKDCEAADKPAFRSSTGKLLATKQGPLERVPTIPLDDYISCLKQPPFTSRLFAYIDRSGLPDSEVYNRAGLDRRLFSKLRNQDYHPGKFTVIALCLALELKMEEAYELLAAAGYSLSNSDTFDLVIRYCIEHNTFTLMEVNEALDYFDLKPLGAVL